MKPQPTWQNLMIRETCAGIGLGLLYPFGFLPSKPASKRLPKDHHTVVLVHGYLSNRSAFLPLKAYLKFHGVRHIVSFEYSKDQSVIESARALREFMRREVRGGRVSFVGHSLGGVVARIYLQMLGGHRRCDTCVTVGSPHKGTYNAYWIPTKVGRDLRPDSAVLEKLEATDKAQGSTKFVSIAGDADNIILPRASAEREKIHRIADTGHLGLLWSPKTMRLVLEHISS